MDIVDSRALTGEPVALGGPAGEAVFAGPEAFSELEDEAEAFPGEFPGEFEGEFGNEFGNEDEFETGPTAAAAPSQPPATRGGRLVVEHVPLLRRHIGTPPDLVLSWNAMNSPGRVDVAVHLHGFSPRGRAMQLPRDMVPVSGLDFADPRHPGTPGRTTPTLAVLPRGNFFGGRSGHGYNHPALHVPGALAALVDHALARFGAHTGIQAARGRLILTAHSGGGASLMRVLAYADPDEVHTFDALYTDPSPLVAWARKRIASNDGGALRVIFRDHEGTAANSGRSIPPSAGRWPPTRARRRPGSGPSRHRSSTWTSRPGSAGGSWPTRAPMYRT